MSGNFAPSRLTMVFAIIVLLAAAVLGGSYWYVSRLANPADDASQGVALIGGPFAMTDHNGKRVTDKDFLGKPMLVSFGFTFCPDVCPTQLYQITEALAALGPKAAAIQPVFVSIDPERDTPEALKSYVANFAPGYVGLTGTPADVAAMARAYRVYYAKVEKPGDPSSYTMDHSSIIYLMDSRGRFLKHFTSKSSAAELAQELGKALEPVDG
jgi:cytochrome oxidase Cu insertion factor (SCO1/SenC/PrrC family)